MIVRDNLQHVLYHNLFDEVSSPGIKRKWVSAVENIIKLIGEKGFDAPTLSQMASVANMTVSNLKYHFKNETELKLFCLKYIRLQYQDHVIKEFLKHSKPKLRLCAYFSASIEWPRQNPSAFSFWMAFFHKACSESRYREISQEMIEVGRDRFAALLAEVTLNSSIPREWSNAMHQRLTHQIIRRSFEKVDHQEDQSFIQASVEECFKLWSTSPIR